MKPRPKDIEMYQKRKHIYRELSSQIEKRLYYKVLFSNLFHQVESQIDDQIYFPVSYRLLWNRNFK